MDELRSSTENIEQTATCIMNAFREMNIEAGQVLPYEKLEPYLHEHSDFDHYKDVQKLAEHHLRKEGYATPDPAGLRLTPEGFQAIHTKDA